MAASISSIQELLVTYLSNGTTSEALIQLGFNSQDIQSAQKSVQGPAILWDEAEPGSPLWQMENSDQQQDQQQDQQPNQQKDAPASLNEVSKQISSLRPSIVSDPFVPDVRKPSIQIGEKHTEPPVLSPKADIYVPEKAQVMPTISEPLALAARQGNIGAMQKLLHDGVSINSIDKNGFSLLSSALLNARPDAVRFILNNPFYQITQIDVDEVEELMREVASSTSPAKATPITLDASRLKVVQATLDVFLESITLERLRHLDIRAIESLFKTKKDVPDTMPLGSPHSNPHVEKKVEKDVPEPILAPEPKPMIFSEPKVNDELSFAAIEGATDKMARLLNNGANINCVDGGGTSLLSNALMNHKASAVKLIMEEPSYKITKMDIEEIECLIDEVENPMGVNFQAAQEILNAFKVLVTPERLAHLDISSIPSLFDDKTKAESAATSSRQLLHKNN